MYYFIFFLILNFIIDNMVAILLILNMIKKYLVYHKILKNFSN